MDTFYHDGHTLAYRQQGNGPLLLVLHGNTASSAMHQGELDHFSRRWRTVALDFLGCGQSERVDVWPDDWWAQGARDAAALVDHLAATQCVVAGTSGGGIAALLMAILFPAKVRAVIADSCVASLPANDVHWLVSQRQQQTAAQIGFWKAAHGDDWQQVVDADNSLMLRFGAAGGRWFDGRLGEIECPVLLTASLTDDMLPDVSAQVCHMAMEIADSRVFFSRSGGHPLMWSRPEMFRDVADCFLKSLL